MEYMALYLFIAVCLVLLIGFPVAFSLAGTALAFAGIGMMLGHFDASFLHAIPNRLFGIVSNTILMAVPLFIFMGVMLEKLKVAENLLDDFFDIIFQSIKKNGKVKIAKFGTFELRFKKSRIGRNPKTKEEKNMSERNVVLFKPSKEFKTFINIKTNE